MATNIVSTPPPGKKVALMPAESELVAFDHSAAGHQGISSNASGSLIIKPCTQAEIDFYESAEAHPLFQAHMPTFIGSLLQHDEQDAPDSTDPLSGAAVVNGTTTTMPSPTLTKRMSWKPSGGKKLSTGLAIVLENVAAGFKHPNVLDVKLGARLWADDAPRSKRQKLDEVAKRTTTGSLGFRVAGMKIRHAEEPTTGTTETNTTSATTPRQVVEEDPAHVEVKNGYKCYTKFYGQSFDQHTVVDAFTTYLGGVHHDPRPGRKTFRRRRGPEIARRLIRELESIQYMLENEESRMYSASVLMVYEGDEDAMEVAIQEEQKAEQEMPIEREDGDGNDLELDMDSSGNNTKAVEVVVGGGDDDDNDMIDDDDDDDDEVPPKVHEVRLIDFAHASWTPGQGPDDNALMGVKNILRILRDLTE
ncbi:uncharacterized protein PV06_09035 [Exophiala oligosperma]|uniref:Kinase n=1 Tax=Exophiala oligosperma TaxID=215243 RepID=A0A0D2D9V4_9EURO|nr:uncharacterized protein PV06_09035 [Exophiala oligosperma]KIW39245.1 hypothetical protein PV06_09035 [Exophiala oligosperma]